MVSNLEVRSHSHLFHSSSATYAGLFTVASYSICPCLLQIFSARILAFDGLTKKTVYQTFFSYETSAFSLAFMGVTVIVYAVVGSSVI